MAIISDYSRAGRALSRRRAAFLFMPMLLAAVALVAALPAAAQYPVETMPAKKSAPDLRAVAVLEWTGKAGHPTAARLIPVSIYNGQQLQDGDIYLARPQPLTLDSDVEYELEQDGKTVGLYDIDNASLVNDAWVGYGTWKPLPKPPTESSRSRHRHIWNGEKENASGRPVLHVRPGAENTSGSGTASGSQAPPPDEGRPTLHRSDSGDNSGNSTPNNSPPDTEGPTLHRTSGDSANSTPPDDSGRPQLRKKKKEKQQDSYNQAYVETVPQVWDPGRPHLYEGVPKPAFAEAPHLVGLPPDMHQVIAVSDANNTPDHPWNFSWANPDDEATMKAALEEIARKDLALFPPPASVPAAAPAATPSSKRRAAHKKTAAASPPPTLLPPTPLVDEQFHVFRLAYGSGATMVFSARTAGTGANEKYITLIAQPGLYGNVFVLFENVTDAAHLDLTPRMRLVGPVDAMADNRGDLLFELRGATERQFALYQVYNGQVTQLLATGAGSFAGEAPMKQAPLPLSRPPLQP